MAMLLLPAGSGFAQMTINNGATPAQLVQSLVGNGVTYSNVTYNGSALGRGLFTGGGIGLSGGVVLSTGNVNTVPAAPSSNIGNATGGISNDPDMNLVCAATTHDASILEFDFVPEGSTLTFRYVFSSEEYPEFAPPCNSPYNDGFGFFISGPGLSGPYLGNTAPNVALIPATTTPVSINNVNAITNNPYYVPNYDNNGGCGSLTIPRKITEPNFAFDGYTVSNSLS